MGPDTTTPLSDAQSSGEGDFPSSPFGSLECSSQNDHALVYLSVDQDGLLWFWPDTRPEFKNIAARKSPPAIPVLTDPAFKDKLYSMNLPYGYKKMIENLLEPAYLPFAHDEPEVDSLEDFEKRLSSAAGHSSSKPSAARAYKEKPKQVSSISNGHAYEADNLVSTVTKSVKNGSANAKLELSFSAVQNGGSVRSTSIYGKANGSSNAAVELSGSGGKIVGKTNGSASANMEIPYDVKQNATSDSSIGFDSEMDSSASEAANDASNTIEAVKSGTDNTKVPRASQKGAEDGSMTASRDLTEHLTEDGSQSGEVLSQSFLGESVKDEVLRTDGADVNRVQSSVVLKKPLSSTRTRFEEKVGRMGDSSDCLDLTPSLQALRRLILQKNFELAKEHAEELYQKYPRDTSVLMEYAFVEKKLGDLVAAGSLYSKAISAFERQQNLGYDYVRALQALGSIEARARNARRARVLFMESIHAARQAERLFPDMVSGASVYGLHAWAQLELQQGNWAKARELLTRAADIQPGNAVVHQSRALLEAKAHNWAEARYHFSLAVESAPRDVKCWHAWAIFEAGQGKQNKMQELFQKALQVDPYSVHCLQAWAHQETLIGTPESKDKARSLLQRCTEIEPKSLYAWQAWAVLEQTSGNHDKARELFEKCLEINPSSVASLQAFANMERHLKNWAAAQRLLRRALKLEPENAAVLMEAAFIENSLGNSELAERLFVLAGMADKRNSRVRNRIFHSRKEIMPGKAGRGWRAIGKNAHRKPVTERNRKPIKAAINAVKFKPEKVDSHSITRRRSSSHLTYRDGNKNTDFPVVTNAIKAKQREGMKNSYGERRPSFRLKKKEKTFQVAIDAIKAKQRELSSTEGQLHVQGEHRSSPNFQAAIDGIEAKLRDLKSDTDMEEQPSFPLKRAQHVPTILGA
ncbi:hypothetical protein GOP47_0012591 [Adiantum capillus-veneris]|uniref:Uncharacterized protein n=1 Tax=Adiantum capillus-veneris TaxID=13818 RepID=A0A9D4URB3_ADICA|nr:hypothetical protein GOP47_0012591 [Adiantum capillus-veneris]